MHPRFIRRVAAVIGIVALATTGLAVASQAVATAKQPRVHLLRTVGPIRSKISEM